MTVGWETLDVGEKALIFSKDGSSRVEEGPQRIFLFREKFHRMKGYSASQKEYLIVKYKSGKEEHIRGPCTRHFNKVIHQSIKVEDLWSISANEALVVYTLNPETNNVSRRVVFGPTLLMVTECEWLHSFTWHGTDPNNKTRMLPNQDKFKILKIIPDQFYYNVDEVRTMDDALLRVKIMMFYELTNVEKMLNSTEDPMADFINCLCADVMAFVAKRTYEEFIENASELNDLKNFPLLLGRCKDIGYTVSKIVFRGYFAHDKLQSTHDMMIKKRTELTLRFEQEVEKQNQTDVKLQSEMDRLEQEQALEMDKLLHSQKMEKDALQHSLQLEKMKNVQMFSEQRVENKWRLNARALEDNLEAEYLSQLHQMNVDVTGLLVAKTGHPQKLTNIRAEQKAAQVHIHHNDLSNPRIEKALETSI